MTKIFDKTQAILGEGPLWHPLRQSLLWFDIEAKRLFERRMNEETARIWLFGENVSAAGWVDENVILIASETALFTFDLRNRERNNIVSLEAGQKGTRSNDGRADFHGGFWIGTMSKSGAPRAGAIYRYYKGELRRLFKGISTPNSICFAHDGKTAYYCDTPTKLIMKTALDDQGWPAGEPEVFVDLNEDGHLPDGSVVDCDGNLWNAQWGSSRIACYNDKGEFVEAIAFDTEQITCPAFGGENMKTLFATSASQGLDATHSRLTQAGAVFQTTVLAKGYEEYRVKL